MTYPDRVNDSEPLYLGRVVAPAPLRRPLLAPEPAGGSRGADGRPGWVELLLQQARLLSQPVVRGTVTYYPLRIAFTYGFVAMCLLSATVVQPLWRDLDPIVRASQGFERLSGSDAGTVFPVDPWAQPYLRPLRTSPASNREVLLQDSAVPWAGGSIGVDVYSSGPDGVDQGGRGDDLPVLDPLCPSMHAYHVAPEVIALSTLCLGFVYFMSLVLRRAPWLALPGAFLVHALAYGLFWFLEDVTYLSCPSRPPPNWEEALAPPYLLVSCTTASYLSSLAVCFFMVFAARWGIGVAPPATPGQQPAPTPICQ